MSKSSFARRAERRERNQQHLDMNLVSLIDIFTILIFFLLSSAAGVELLAAPTAVKLPESLSDTAPRQTTLVTVAGDDIFVGTLRVALVSESLAHPGDEIPGLSAELRRMAARDAESRAQARAEPLDPTRAPARTPAPAQAVTLMADKDIPYRLLRKVLSTCAHANGSEVSLAVRQSAKVAS